MQSGPDDSREFEVMLVGSPTIRSSTEIEQLSFQERAETVAIRVHDLLESVMEQTKTAARGCSWEVEVSGVFAVGGPGAKMEFDAKFKLSSAKPPAAG